MNIQQTIDMLAARKLEGRLDYQGMQISVESDKGSVRKWTDLDGTKGETKMLYPYGYIRGTEGTDEEHVDCYVGPNADAPKVYVVHQNDHATGEYDEDKCMLGFDSAKEAKEAYLAHYDKPGFFGSMDEYSIEEFKELVYATKDEPGRIAAGYAFHYNGSWPFLMDARPSGPHPPSLKNPQYVPADTPNEKHDRFLDVTKRKDKETQRFRAGLTMKKGYPVPIQRVTQSVSQMSVTIPFGAVRNR